MVEKLLLPFPILSDPDRSEAITPLGVDDPKDKRMIARTAVVLLRPDGSEVFRWIGRDFADRLTEDEILEHVRALGLRPTSQVAPLLGPAEPGPKAIAFEQLYPYFRGARWAAVAMARRHPDIRLDAERYIAQVDRYIADVQALFRVKREIAEGG